LFKLKIVQTQKLFKFENYSDFAFIQIRKLFGKGKNEITSRTSEPGEKKNCHEKTKNHKTLRQRAAAHIPPPAGGAYKSVSAGGA
jgi:hypothetical protein